MSKLYFKKGFVNIDPLSLLYLDISVLVFYFYFSPPKSLNYSTLFSLLVLTIVDYQSMMLFRGNIKEFLFDIFLWAFV